MSLSIVSLMLLFSASYCSRRGNLFGWLLVLTVFKWKQLNLLLLLLFFFVLNSNKLLAHRRPPSQSFWIIEKCFFICSAKFGFLYYMSLIDVVQFQMNSNIFISFDFFWNIYLDNLLWLFVFYRVFVRISFKKFVVYIKQIWCVGGEWRYSKVLRHLLWYIANIIGDLSSKRTIRFGYTIKWRTHKTRLFIRIFREMIEIQRPPERLFYSH